METKKNTLKELSYERNIYDKLNSKINNLEGAKNNISTFLGLLLKEKNKSFGNIKKVITNLDLLNGAILIFVNSNSKSLKKESKINYYIEYFLELLSYYHFKNIVGSLYYFNIRKLDSLEKYSIEIKEQYVFIQDDIFIHKVIEQLNIFIDNLIDELEDEKYKIEDNILEGEIDLVEEFVAEILMIEDLIQGKIDDFNKICSYMCNDDNIGIVLNNNNLFEKQENLYYFIENNKEKFLINSDGKKIYNFIVGISENMHEMNLKEYLEKNKISYMEFLNLGKKFGEIISKF